MTIPNIWSWSTLYDMSPTLKLPTFVRSFVGTFVSSGAGNPGFKGGVSREHTLKI